MSGIHIGQLAKKTGLSIDTIRFYEKQGLLIPDSREHSQRHYTLESLARAQFVQRAKKLGFTLKEIADLTNLKADSKKTCIKVHRQANRKIREIDAKLKDLLEIRLALQKVVTSCRGGVPLGKCSLLEAL